jgi:hypothetical protein
MIPAQSSSGSGNGVGCRLLLAGGLLLTGLLLTATTASTSATATAAATATATTRLLVMHSIDTRLLLRRLVNCGKHCSLLVVCHQLVRPGGQSAQIAVVVFGQ